MKQFLFSTKLPDGREICVAPVSVDVFEDNDVRTLGDDTGYFIYEYDTAQSAAGIEILAKAASYDAALRIIDIFLTVQRQGAATHSSLPPDALPPLQRGQHPPAS